MKEKVEALMAHISSYTVSNNDELEKFRMEFISRKSVVADLFAEMKNVAPEERKQTGAILNGLKNHAEEKFKELIATLNARNEDSSSAPVDLTLPPISDTLGSLHPLTLTKKRIIQIFERIGFNVSYGPEIEDDRF